MARVAAVSEAPEGAAVSAEGRDRADSEAARDRAALAEVREDPDRADFSADPADRAARGGREAHAAPCGEAAGTVRPRRTITAAGDTTTAEAVLAACCRCWALSPPSQRRWW